MPSRLPAAERREQLLDVAMTVFSEHGYHGASMNDVAAQAGVTKPVLYQHFPSKRELYLELIDGVSSQLAEGVTVAAAGATDGRSQAEAALTAYFRFVEENQRAFRLLFGRGAPREEEFGSGSRLVEDRMAATISGLLDDRMDSETREVYARAIVGMSEGVCRHWVSQGSRNSADSLAKQVADLLISGLSGLYR
ncbi:MAG: TetR/AcrR family transcriptional regulator [Actinomycetota bacterium]|jgi:AcrR family transcriptional regulator|nr:TetR/AcrR family transcriptional regulator [Actinomycetota bacterium]